MTRCYRLDASASMIGQVFDADPGGDPWDGGVATPGLFAPVITDSRKGGRRLTPRLWGVPPPPGTAMAGGAPIAHVRNLDSPFWTGNLRHSEFRCLVPVTSFQLQSRTRDPRTGKRLPHGFSLPDRPLFAFAGLWRDSEVLSFALLTCAPNRLVAATNPATMPVILHARDHETWLRADWRIAQRLVAPFPSQLMRADGG